MNSRHRASTAGENAVPDRAHVRGRRGDEIQFFTIVEIAQRLNVSSRTIRRWIERGELVAYRFGAVLRIAESDLRAFLALRRDG